MISPEPDTSVSNKMWTDTRRICMQLESRTFHMDLTIAPPNHSQIGTARQRTIDTIIYIRKGVVKTPV